MTDKIKCSHCERHFADANAVRQHHNKKHHGKKLDKAVKAAIVRQRDDGEESFASRSIDAQLDHAMGIHNDDYDWLVGPYQ